MRILNHQVFDEVISGTGISWYSRSDFNRILGAADYFCIQACTTDVSGVGPAIAVASEYSSDGQDWATLGLPINTTFISEDGSYAGTMGLLDGVLGANLRFRIVLGGISPKCRFKLYVTGRGRPGPNPPQDFTEMIFDERISGTGTNWYTSADFNDRLGTGDQIALHAVTTAVSGGSPTLTCRVETSANGKDWYAAQTTPEINASAMVNGKASQGQVPAFLPVLQRYARVRVSLGGSSPACRVKLYATGRTW